MKTYFGMATCGGRAKALQDAVESLLSGDVAPEKIFIVPDDRAGEVLPQCFKHKDSRVEVVRLPVAFSKGDANKVWPLMSGLVPADCIFATVDDDLYYPLDYLSRLIDGLTRHPNAFVGNHGIRIAPPATLYYSLKGARISGGMMYERFSVTDEWTGLDQNVHVLGTGALAATTDTWRKRCNFCPSDIKATNSLDIWLAIKAQQTHTPMWLLPHTPALLTPHIDHEVDTIYHATLKDEDKHKLITDAVNAQEWRMWDDDGQGHKHR